MNPRQLIRTAGMAALLGALLGVSPAHSMVPSKLVSLDADDASLPAVLKILAEKETHRIIGAQIVGGEEVNGRINWLTAAIFKGVTAEEFVSSFENAYCPPTSMVKDVVNQAAEALMERLKATCDRKPN